MINISTIKRFACLSVTAAAALLVSGSLSEAQAQRDPFQKATWATPKKASVPSKTSAAKAGPPVPVNYGAPPIESRIEYYKHLREIAAANGSALPKVTSVLTLNEMQVTGIFKTPRGYAAMVEATPIKLSYTIYPGEKFFDGQLVAVEENRLVFRKVTKVGDGKFVASVENKPLKSFSMKAQIEGTAPAQPGDKTTQVATNNPPPTPGTPMNAKTPAKPPTNPFLSPLDEMNNMKPESETDKAKKPAKKPVKVAKNGGTE